MFGQMRCGMNEERRKQQEKKKSRDGRILNLGMKFGEPGFEGVSEDTNHVQDSLHCNHIGGILGRE